MISTAMPWQSALAVFLGTLPILGVILWNLLEVKSIRGELIDIRKELLDIRKELLEIHKELGKMTERIATLEERDRWTHPISRP